MTRAVCQQLADRVWGAANLLKIKTLQAADLLLEAPSEVPSVVALGICSPVLGKVAAAVVDCKFPQLSCQIF